MPRRTSGGGEKRIEVPGSGATPIVHVGFPKTASTWFQKAFYPHVRSPRYVGREKLFSALIEPNALTFDPAGAVSTLGLKAGEAVLLSDECLCGYLHNGGIDGMVTREFARRIKAALPDARIVIFLRSQPGMIVAAYQQYLRSGGTYSRRTISKGPRRSLTSSRGSTSIISSIRESSGSTRGFSGRTRSTSSCSRISGGMECSSSADMRRR
jgi:hypothetical protein